MDPAYEDLFNLLVYNDLLIYHNCNMGHVGGLVATCAYGS